MIIRTLSFVLAVEGLTPMSSLKAFAMLTIVNELVAIVTSKFESSSM